MKNIKIYDDEKNIYSGNFYVNTVIFKGRLPKTPKQISNEAVKFTIQLSNGKNDQTGEWLKPTFADCTAFGGLAQKILKNYHEKDPIWVIAKYYVNERNGKYYQGFIVREVLTENELEKVGKEILDDVDLPF